MQSIASHESDKAVIVEDVQVQKVNKADSSSPESVIADISLIDASLVKIDDAGD